MFNGVTWVMGIWVTTIFPLYNRTFLIQILPHFVMSYTVPTLFSPFVDNKESTTDSVAQLIPSHFVFDWIYVSCNFLYHVDFNV